MLVSKCVRVCVCVCVCVCVRERERDIYQRKESIPLRRRTKRRDKPFSLESWRQMCFMLRQDQRKERSKVLTKYQFVNLRLDGKQHFIVDKLWASSTFNNVRVSAEKKKKNSSYQMFLY